MADVTILSLDRSRRRGQFLVVTALVIAIVLVAAVTLLNTVIFVENVATRDTDVGGESAIAYREATVEGVGDIIDAETYALYGTWEDLSENATAAIEQYDSLLAERYATAGASVGITNVTLAEGRLLRQANGTRALTDVDGTANWTLATGVRKTGVRRFVLEPTDATESNITRAFHVTVEGANGNEWKAYIYEDSGEIALAVDNGSGSLTKDVCSPSATPTVDLSAGTVDGQPCPSLSFAKGVDAPYDIRYRNGDTATGNYSLVVNTSASGTSINDGNFADYPTNSSPSSAPAVYSATIDIRYRSPVIHFVVENRRIAPGEST